MWRGELRVNKGAVQGTVVKRAKKKRKILFNFFFRNESVYNQNDKCATRIFFTIHSSPFASCRLATCL